MTRLALIVAIFMIAGISMPAFADKTPAPSGWTETLTDEGREISKATAKVVIGNWQSLRGQSLQTHMKGLEKMVPDGSQLVSSRGVKPERVDGAYSVTRKINLHGKSGQSVLYGCPGQSGFARVISMTFETSDFGSALTGGMFLEKVCKQEPKGGASDTEASASAPTPQVSRPNARASTVQSSPISTSHGTYNLAAENAKIPSDSRPVKAVTILEEKWVGFPATLTYTAEMMMQFPNGYATHCTKWNLISQTPMPESIGGKRCKVTRENIGTESRLNGFTPGETVDLAFGRISASGIDGADSSSISFGGGDLILSKDGRIAIGKFNAFSVNANGGNSGVGGGTRRQVKGRYYLNGHTITIETENGDLFHTFIGWQSDKNGRKIDHVFFAGDHYWDKDK